MAVVVSRIARPSVYRVTISVSRTSLHFLGRARWNVSQLVSHGVVKHFPSLLVEDVIAILCSDFIIIIITADADRMFPAVRNLRPSSCLIFQSSPSPKTIIVIAPLAR